MSSESEKESATTRIKTERRYWRRTDTPKPWWPWGLVPAAGLVMLFLFGALFTAPRIEAEIREQVTSRFDSVGVETTEVASDGQGVRVRAEAPGDDTIYLQALAKATQCDTWAGKLTCPTSVNVIVDERDEVEGAPAQLTRRPHPIRIARTDNAVTLSGEVPNLAEHDRIVGAAGQLFDIVTDELIISAEQATDYDARAANVSLALVRNLSSGEASWSGQALSVSGVAPTHAIAATREQFDSFGSGPLLGDFDVRAINDAQGCNKRFNDILTSATVRFQTSSATIDAGNGELLLQLAELARSCPGTLIVEGHTDSRGDADMNKTLSLARATAVRDALAKLGVDAERVSAAGFGSTQPIADNATADGRAKNRRIAITISENN